MSILIKIREYQHISQAESFVQKFILKHPNEFLSMKVREVAEYTFTSPATVVRFCKRIEPMGFNILKIKLSREVESYKNTKMEILDTTMIKSSDTYQDIRDKITQINLDSIRETELLLDRETIESVAFRIMNAKVIDLYGVGASNVVATDAAYKFMRIGKVVQFYQLIDRQRVQARNSNGDHMAILFSFSGETKEMVDIAQTIQQTGTPSVSIIGKIGSKLASCTDYNIYVSAKETTFRSGAMASRTAQLYIVDIIYAMCHLFDYDKTHERVSKTRIDL